MRFQVTVLDTGRLYMGRVAGGDGPAALIMAPALAFLVRGPGCCVLVDTGMPDTARAALHKPHCDQPPGWEVTARLAEMGLSPGDLTALIFTHLHWDHAAWPERFPGVPKYLQHGEAEHASQLPEDMRIYYDTAPAILADPDLRLVRGRTEILPGLELIPTPGHTPGHQAVGVGTNDGQIILAGDAVWMDASHRPQPPRYAFDPETAQETYRELTGLGLPLWAGHDRSAMAPDPQPRSGRAPAGPTQSPPQGAAPA